MLQVLGWKAAATAAQRERDVVLHHARLAAHQQQIAVAQLATAVQATLSGRPAAVCHVCARACARGGQRRGSYSSARRWAWSTSTCAKLRVCLRRRALAVSHVARTGRVRSCLGVLESRRACLPVTVTRSLWDRGTAVGDDCSSVVFSPPCARWRRSNRARQLPRDKAEVHGFFVKHSCMVKC